MPTPDAVTGDADMDQDALGRTFGSSYGGARGTGDQVSEDSIHPALKEVRGAGSERICRTGPNSRAVDRQRGYSLSTVDFVRERAIEKLKLWKRDRPIDKGRPP